MQKLAIVLSLSLTSCAWTQDKNATLSAVQEAAIAARMAIQPVIDATCQYELEKCGSEMLVSDCPGYELCDKVRGIIIRTLQGVQFAIVDAQTALAIGDSKSHAEAVARALDLLIQVRQQMAILGIIPGGE